MGPEMYQWLATSLHSSSLSDQACDQFASDNKSVFMRAKKEILHVADFCCFSLQRKHCKFTMIICLDGKKEAKSGISIPLSAHLFSDVL